MGMWPLFFFVSGAPLPPTTHQQKNQLFWWVVAPLPPTTHKKNPTFLVTGAPLSPITHQKYIDTS